jgi:hypothetical protein
MTNEKPILFSTEMVKAILEGRKSQTRRIVKPQPWSHTKRVLCPYGKLGDILWVRETWAHTGAYHIFKAGNNWGEYYVDENYNPTDKKIQWKPSIHMPRAACRIRLEITDIRVERLQDISWEDVVAEGCPGYRPTQDEPTQQFQRLWQSINGEESWQSNPWVWVISFHTLKNRHNGRE